MPPVACIQEGAEDVDVLAEPQPDLTKSQQIRERIGQGEDRQEILKIHGVMKSLGIAEKWAGLRLRGSDQQ